MSKKENNGGVTAEQISDWKCRYHKVYEITVADGDETHKGYFRRPDMDTLSASTVMAKRDEIKAAGVLFENCFLGGSTTLREDAVVQMSAVGQLNVIVSQVVASVKNL